MKKNSFGQGLAVFLVVIGIFYIIGAISEASEPKHDANYMYHLFCKCYKEYTRWTNQEICYLSPTTHIIHSR